MVLPSPCPCLDLGFYTYARAGPCVSRSWSSLSVTKGLALVLSQGPLDSLFGESQTSPFFGGKFPARSEILAGATQESMSFAFRARFACA